MNPFRLSLRHALYGMVGTLLLIAMTGQVRPVAAQSAPDENEKRTHYSLYYENFKNENYADALPDLRWILQHAPSYPSDDDRNFERAVEAFVGLAEQAEDEQQKRAYLDSALAYAEKAVPALESAGAEVDPYVWSLEKGRIIQSNSEILADRQEEMMQAYQSAYETAPDKIDPYYIDRIMRAYVLSDQKDQAMAMLEDLEANRAEEEKIQELVSTWGPRIFTTPDERVAYLERQLERSPDDMEVAEDLFDLYMQEGRRDDASRLANRLMESTPSPRITRMVAKMRLEDGEPQKAFDLYQQIVNDAEEAADADTYYNMGIAQQQMNQLSRARTYFRQAIEADPSFGRAYLAIGDLYARAVSQCGGGQMEPADQAVYWLVVDYYQRAKNADPSLSGPANQNISTYRQYFPNKERMFFNDWTAGQSFTIDYGCYSWIGETTTIKEP